MKSIVSNQYGFSGNILIAITAIMVSVIATMSFMLMIEADNKDVTLLQDKFQQDLFMRSEVKRMSILLSRNTGMTTYPSRVIEMNNDDRLATYTIKVRSSKVVLGSFLGYATQEAYSMRALITEKYTRKQFSASGNASPIKKMIEKLSNRESLAQYQYFTDSEMSNITNDDPMTNEAARVKFYGADELWGKVHSNSDIWIQQGGGTVNQQASGWPLFHALVTTGGIFMKHESTPVPLIGSGAPVDNIFQGEPLGYQENVSKIVYEPTARLIKQNGASPWGQDVSQFDRKILKLKIAGTSVQVEELDFTSEHMDTFVVYKRYPDALHPVQFGNQNTYIRDSLWTNRITIRDTIWTTQASISTGRSVYVPAETWIEGSLRGSFTVGTGGNAYITSDISYATTTIGNPPDNSETGVNRTDYFGLVSEKSILIKYKYRQKVDGVYTTFADNSEGPNGNVYLYGAYAAIGPELDSQDGYREAGVFSYEYQHPHGAVMPFWGKSQKTNADTLYKYIDFHRHRFPNPSTSNNTPLWTRWPYVSPSHGFPNNPTAYGDYTQSGTAPMYGGSDWPWYNPVWPEKDGGAAPQNIETDLVWERGTLHIFGSIAQRRRGFVHRSGNMDDDLGPWDLPYIQGPAHNMNGYGSTGYKKDYHYDQRFMIKQPPDFPEIYRGSSANMMTAFEETTWNFKVPPKNDYDMF